mmetsp:Transcript_99208/g.265333  ORF Transcript_99208/g.265333 Transcript_99208/m.265333 type:complete len:565 (-) Transcript_99208:85-1779(-)
MADLEARMREEAAARAEEMRLERERQLAKLAEKEQREKDQQARVAAKAAAAERAREEEKERIRAEQAKKQEEAEERARRQERLARERQQWTALMRAKRSETKRAVKEAKVVTGSLAALEAIQEAKRKKQGGAGAGPADPPSSSTADSEAPEPAAAPPARQAPRAPVPATPGLTDDGTLCAVCCREPEFWFIPSCDHALACSECALTLRVLHEDQRCLQCQGDVEVAVVAPRAEPFDSFRIVDRVSTRAGVRYDHTFECFFTDEAHRQELLHVYHGDQCPEEGCGWEAGEGGLAELKKHLWHVHWKEFCSLCLKNQKFFVLRQPAMTQEELRQHLNHGDGSSFFGHPKCPFCAHRAYDDGAMHDHMRQKHFICQLCQRANRKGIYFKDFKQLQHHFRREHHYCERGECKEIGMVVFETAVELQIHRIEDHGETNAVVVDVAFNVTSAPEREPAPASAAPHRPFRPADQDFPSLSQAVPVAPQWTAPAAKAPPPTRDAFPALGAGGYAKAGGAKARPGGKAPPAVAAPKPRPGLHQPKTWANVQAAQAAAPAAKVSPPAKGGRKKK